jgi:uncharacterized protein (DUF488 family)
MNAGSESSIRLYTIGHSTRSFEDFLSLLTLFGIQTLTDIRSRPGSRKFPHFDRENLEKVLPEHGVDYVWIPELGGLRRSDKESVSPNMGLTSPGFRNYADYMAEAEFKQGVSELLAIAVRSLTAYTCAEAVWWRCHRRLLSDYLVAHGLEVFHIVDSRSLHPHKITEGAVVSPEGNLLYPPA